MRRHIPQTGIHMFEFLIMELSGQVGAIIIFYFRSH
jgi:hypothetical protein